MNAKIKDVLGISLIVLIVVAVVSLLSFTHSFKKSVADTAPSFSVSGEGEVVAVPDVAQFSFSVITEGDEDLEGLQADNTEKMNGIIEYLKGKDIDEKDIKTSNYNVSPRYNYFSCVDDGRGRECPPPEIAGYTVSQNVAVKVRNMDDTGSLLGGVVTNGANNVSQLRFTIDDPDDLKAQAREEAFAKAQEKAKAIAEAGGFKLGRLLSVQESDSGYSPPMPYAAEDSLGRGSGAPAQIEPGSQDVKVTVNLQYEIK